MENGRHKGFNDKAKEVSRAVSSYLSRHGIDGDVKYWISGFSRAAAVANLTAGFITKDAARYQTTQEDVYGYTWECPQGAAVTENPLEYKNIHNILNALDAVPKVSPTEFEHQRLSVDYYMPYYRNTNSPEENTAYYNRMYEVLKTIAVGTTINGNYKEDLLIKSVNPDNYPYNRPLELYTIDFWQLIGDAASGKPMENFGTKPYTGSGKLGGGGWYIDTYIDNLINVFLTSYSWDRDFPNQQTEDILTHRERFISNYQEDFRTLMGYLLGYSGPAFMDMIGDVVQAVEKAIGIEFNITAISKLVGNFPLAVAFYKFYTEPTKNYAAGMFSFWPSDWKGKSHKDVLIMEAQDLVVDVIDNLTEGYTNAEGIKRSDVDKALKHLTALVVDLYAVELSQFNSQYFGTTLHWLNEILSTHEQETVLSWIMAVDPNHVNRSFRTLTVPATANVALHVFREGMEDSISVHGEAPVIAEFKNGRETFNKDQRIYAEKNGDSMVIRYPASLDIRADITVDTKVDDLDFAIGDFHTSTDTVDVSKDVSQYKRLSATGVYSDETRNTDALRINKASEDYVVPMSEKDVLYIMTPATLSYNDMTTEYTVDKDVYVNTIVEGQYISDENGSKTFQTAITNDSGEEINRDALTAQFAYTTTRGDALRADNELSHLGRDFTISVPEVESGHYVDKYYMTDATEMYNKQLSSGSNENIPADAELKEDMVQMLNYGNEPSLEAVLGLEDKVFHVFYSGSPATLETVTRFVDYNGRILLATNADEPMHATSNTGVFGRDGKNNAYYKLTSQIGTGKEPDISVLAYNGVDMATVKGNHIDASIGKPEEKQKTKQVTVVPASSVYIDDDLTETDPIVTNGHGYSYSSLPSNTQQREGSWYFTFTGTAIDIYCTTHDAAGYVSAGLYRGDASQVKYANLVKDYNNENILVTMKNNSSDTMLNVPTIHMDCPEYGTYTVKLFADEGSNYKLDGVRVYGAVNDGALDGTTEEKAQYFNLREYLLNNDSTFSAISKSEYEADYLADDEKIRAISGILYLDTEKLSFITKDENGKEKNTYKSEFDTYDKNSPKNEIYLTDRQGISFALNNWEDIPKEARVYLGLRTPKGVSDNGATVKINGMNLDPIKSSMDMYYDISNLIRTSVITVNGTEKTIGVITIQVDCGDQIVSVTNLKVTGADLGVLTGQDVPEDATPKLALAAKRMAFAPMMMSVVEENFDAAESDEKTETADTPTVDSQEKEPEGSSGTDLDSGNTEASESIVPADNTDGAHGTDSIQSVIKKVIVSISKLFQRIFRW